MSYAKASGVAVKGDYCNKNDLPINERYKSEMKDRYQKPKIRSFSEARELEKEEEKRKMLNSINLNFIENPKDIEMTKGLSQSFKNAVFMKRKKVEDMPYILGYTGFRPGVVAQSYFGKSLSLIHI